MRRAEVFKISFAWPCAVWIREINFSGFTGFVVSLSVATPEGGGILSIFSLSLDAATFSPCAVGPEGG